MTKCHRIKVHSCYENHCDSLLYAALFPVINRLLSSILSPEVPVERVSVASPQIYTDSTAVISSQHLRFGLYLRSPRSFLEQARWVQWINEHLQLCVCESISLQGVNPSLSHPCVCPGLFVTAYMVSCPLSGLGAVAPGGRHKNKEKNHFEHNF